MSTTPSLIRTVVLAPGPRARAAYQSQLPVQQALLLAGVSYVPAWFIAEGLYRLTSWLTNLPISMNTPRLGMVLVMTVAMCVISGVLALRKLRKVDPAELF